jgi:hypothetical protein
MPRFKTTKVFQTHPRRVASAARPASSNAHRSFRRYPSIVVMLVVHGQFPIFGASSEQNRGQGQKAKSRQSKECGESTESKDRPGRLQQSPDCNNELNSFLLRRAVALGPGFVSRSKSKLKKRSSTMSQTGGTQRGVEQAAAQFNTDRTYPGRWTVTRRSTCLFPQRSWNWER